MDKKEEKKYTDFSNVEQMKNRLIPEEFPEGTYGSSINIDEPVKGKSTPWEEGQYRDSAFVYPDRERHEDLPRKALGSHPLNSRHKDNKEQ